MREHFLWVERYRPKRISETILPDDIKSTFQKFVDDGNIPNLLLTGSAGVGKTTVAKAMLEEVGADYIIINGSMNGNIDTLRNDIKNFASTVSLNGERKVVILDEADYLNPQSTQPALRGFIEEFSKNCSFILTCNFKNRIIAPLHSRCSVIDFRIENGEKPKLAGQFFKRVKSILADENVSANDKVVAELINRHFPDNRRILNELQRYGASGTIDEGILSASSDASMKELMQQLKEKNFKEVRKWVAFNIDNDPVQIFRSLYDSASTYVSPRSIPQLVVTLADYQYKSAFVADQEINLVACLTELMVECEFN